MSQSIIAVVGATYSHTFLIESLALKLTVDP
jgi:hypothetical protein